MEMKLATYSWKEMARTKLHGRYNIHDKPCKKISYGDNKEKNL